MKPKKHLWAKKFLGKFLEIRKFGIFVGISYYSERNEKGVI